MNRVARCGACPTPRAGLRMPAAPSRRAPRPCPAERPATRGGSATDVPGGATAPDGEADQLRRRGRPRPARRPRSAGWPRRRRRLTGAPPDMAGERHVPAVPPPRRSAGTPLRFQPGGDQPGDPPYGRTAVARPHSGGWAATTARDRPSRRRRGRLRRGTLATASLAVLMISVAIGVPGRFGIAGPPVRLTSGVAAPPTTGQRPAAGDTPAGRDHANDSRRDTAGSAAVRGGTAASPPPSGKSAPAGRLSAPPAKGPPAPPPGHGRVSPTVGERVTPRRAGHPAPATGGRHSDAGGDRAWPVRGEGGSGRPDVLRPWQPPPAPWLAGHRGVDLTAHGGQPVRAVAAGRVLFAGPVAGRGVLTIEVDGSGAPPLRTTYEPVLPAVRRGQRVTAGQLVGRLQAGGPSHCAARCVHWGLRRADRYLDPLSLLPPGTRRGGHPRLLPVHTEPEPSGPRGRLAPGDAEGDLLPPSPAAR